MDLLSQKSCSVITSTSTDVDSENQDENDRFNELVSYYNQVIRKNNKSKGNLINRNQAGLDKNINKMTPDNLPVTMKNQNRNIFMMGKEQMNPKISTDKEQSTRNLEQTIPNLEPKVMNSDYVSCTKNFPRQPRKVDKFTYAKPKNKYVPFQNIDSNKAGPAYAEKTTYCRPAVDMYTQEFIHKTVQRNARLQGLVRRLVLAREREKQRVAWNNYINELKNKHRQNSSESRTIPNCMPQDANPEIIDYYNTRFPCKQSEPSQNFLQDFYSVSNEIIPQNQKHSSRQRPYNYGNNSYCFPTSSQGRFITINQERPRYYLPSQSHYRPCSRYPGTPIFVEKENIQQSFSKPSFKRVPSIRNFDFKKSNTIRSMSIQTEMGSFNDNSNNEHNTEETFKEKYNKVNSNVEKLKQKIMETQFEVKYCTLSNIENKLDDLIHSINTFIHEIKSQRVSTDSKIEAVPRQQSYVSSQMNSSKSDTFGIRRREELFCGMVQEQTRSTLAFNEGKRQDALGDILYEKVDKSVIVKRDIEDVLNNSDSSNRPNVHITFDIPTKEHGTEITDSINKTGNTSKVVIEEIGCQNNRRMTIAVNTDPLGILALFRVSAETVKQILTYMPHIDYYSYLSMLPLPQMSKNEISHYVCNICGAAFGRPSQLSDHIQQHDLGNSRNCCVCRHILDMPRHRAGLFPCQHCGQRFTRAYCRELHQQDCGRRIGRTPDISPSLMMLQ